MELTLIFREASASPEAPLPTCFTPTKCCGYAFVCGFVCRHSRQEVIYWYCCQSTEEIKVTGREWRARTKTEIVTTDLQPHAGNAAWLHHPSHMGLCNSLDTVHSHDPAPIQETLIWATGLISAGARKIFGKIKFVRSKVALLRLPVESMVASDDSGSAQPRFTSSTSVTSVKLALAPRQDPSYRNQPVLRFWLLLHHKEELLSPYNEKVNLSSLTFSASK